MDYGVVSAIVVPVSVLGASILSYSPGVERFGRRPDRTATLFLATVAYLSLTVLLLCDTDYDPWWILPPYTGIPAGALFWCFQWRRGLGLGRVASMSVAIAAFSLWAMVAYTPDLVWRQWMLALVTMIYVHALFYEFWVEGHRSYFEHED